MPERTLTVTGHVRMCVHVFGCADVPLCGCAGPLKIDLPAPSVKATKTKTKTKMKTQPTSTPRPKASLSTDRTDRFRHQAMEAAKHEAKATQNRCGLQPPTSHFARQESGTVAPGQRSQDHDEEMQAEDGIEPLESARSFLVEPMLFGQHIVEQRQVRKKQIHPKDAVR